MITAALTAAYMTRAVYLTFFGEYRGHAHPHESGRRITTPLVILAGLAMVVGFLNIPKPLMKFFGLPEGWGMRFEHWVEPAEVSTFVTKSQNGFTHAYPSLPLAVVATGVGLIAGFVVWRYYSALYAKDPKATEYTDGIMSKVGLLGVGHRVLENKYYLDHLYNDVVVASVKGPIAKGAYWFNQNVIDKVVDTAG